MKSVTKRILSVILSIVIMLVMAVPLCFNVLSSENTTNSDTEGTSSVTEGFEMKKSYDAKKGILTLEAYATGESVIKKEIKTKPTDIVLVLDDTSSMDWDCDIAYTAEQLNSIKHEYADMLKYKRSAIDAFGGDVRWNSDSGVWEYKSAFSGWKELNEFDSSHYIFGKRINALKISAEKFIESIAESNPMSRVGLVTFGGKSSSDKVYGEAKVIKELTSCTAEGKKALVTDLFTLDSDYASTAQSTGLKRGLTLFSKPLAEDERDPHNEPEQRDKIMLMFTDGDPVDEGYDDGIAEAKKVKDEGVILYTVGLFDSDTGDASDYIKYMSSKYPAAESMKNHGSDIDGTYSYMVNQSAKLSDILEWISNDLVENNIKFENLDKSTILRDIISKEFKLSDGESDKIHVYTSSYVGQDKWSDLTELTDTDEIVIKYDKDTRTVDVSGFDYSKNWCGTETNEGKVSYHGQKLIVTIPIKPVDGAHGATGINTNDEDSGIITPDGPIGEFPVPTTDIPTNIKIKKVFTGYELPDGVSFNAEASVTGHITGYEDPDENNYTKAVIESKTYNDIVFSESNLTYDGIKDILVSSDTRDSFITVTEKAVSSDFKVTIEDNFGHKITKVGDGGDVSFENIPVNDGMEITITNENLKYVPKFADVTVKQTVSGNFADMEQEFDFGTNYTSSGENDSFTGKIKATDEPKVFGSIDLGSTFTIYEKPVEGYVTTVKVNGEYITPVEGQYVDPVSGKVVENVNKVYVFTVDKDSVVEIDSCYNVEVPVGVHLDSLPYIVLAAFIFLILLVLIVLKRRKRILTDSGI